MDCHQFFISAIDPGEKHDPAIRREVIEHRRVCEGCRGLEQDFEKILALGRLVIEPGKKSSAAFKAELMAIGGKQAAIWRQQARRRLACKAVLVAASLGSVFLGAGLHKLSRHAELDVRASAKPIAPPPSAPSPAVPEAGGPGDPESDDIAAALLLISPTNDSARVNGGVSVAGITSRHR